MVPMRDSQNLRAASWTAMLLFILRIGRYGYDSPQFQEFNESNEVIINSQLYISPIFVGKYVSQSVSR